MKKLFLLFSMMALAFNASAQDYLAVDNITVRPGNSATLVINYHFNELPEGQRMAGYQLDITCPEGVTIDLANTKLGEGYYDDGFALMSNKPDKSVNLYRYVGFPMPIDGKMTCMKGTEGVLLNIPVIISEDVQIGTVFDCIIDAIVFTTSGNVQLDDFADVPFTITVSDDAVDMILDENSTEAPTAKSDANVKVLRTIKGGEWSTICLPFAMTEAQVKDAFGTDVQLANMTGATSSTLEGNDDYIYKIDVNFSAVTAIEANHPYIIKTSNDTTEFNVLHVNVAPNANPRVGASRNYMIGNYENGTKVPASGLFLSDNKFWYSNGNTKMKGFRAYFTFRDVLTKVEEAGAKVNILFDGDATGIANIEKQDTNDKIYSVGGQYMGTDASRLQRGVYIVNGKKVVKK